MLLDEPFGALDALTRLSMRALLLDLWREHGFGVLLVTHDVDEAVALADRVLVLEDGRVAHTLEIDDPRRRRANAATPSGTAPSCSTGSASPLNRRHRMRGRPCPDGIAVLLAALAAVTARRLRVARGVIRRRSRPRNRPAVRAGRCHPAHRRPEGRHPGAAAGRGALETCRSVEFSTFTSGPPQIEAATAGKIDFAITGNTPPIFGAASNAKVKVVSAYDGGGFGDQILVHADSPSSRSATCGARASRSPKAAPHTAIRWSS